MGGAIVLPIVITKPKKKIVEIISLAELAYYQLTKYLLTKINKFFL